MAAEDPEPSAIANALIGLHRALIAYIHRQAPACVDLGSQTCRNSGFTDDELLTIPRYSSSDLFTAQEKAALDLTVGFMRTPVEISDEVFAGAKQHFSDRQLVANRRLTLVNLDRFNAAFGIGSAGCSEGAVCVSSEKLGTATGSPA